jgi:L-asparaginase/Glu-tRNA(Gln) amidotransferase subunit D
VIHLVPGFDDSVLNVFIRSSNSLRALVLLLYGSGNAPSKRRNFIEALLPAKEHNVEIVVASQCRFGSVNLDSYANGKQLIKHGVINGFDMTVESCVAKLAYLMGLGFRAEQLKIRMEKNIRGEITEEPKFQSNL